MDSPQAPDRLTLLADVQPADLQPGNGGGRESAPERDPDHAGGAGPLGDPSPLVVSLFEAANNRKSSPLERVLLSELERDAGPAARAAGSSGAEWVAAALREAVASGSSFVAPKRIREIVTRWSAEGRGSGGGRSLTPESSYSSVRASEPGSPGSVKPAPDNQGHRDDARRWRAVLQDLARSFDETTFDRLLSSSAALGYSGSTLVVRVDSWSAADKLSRDYRTLVERALQREYGRPVAVRFVAEESSEAPEPADPSETPDAPILVTPDDRERGQQLWRAVLDELKPSLPAGDLDRLRRVLPLGQNAQGELVLGMPNQLVEQLVGSRYRDQVERAVSSILGAKLSIRPVSQDGWSVSDS